MNERHRLGGLGEGFVSGLDAEPFCTPLEPGGDRLAITVILQQYDRVRAAEDEAKVAGDRFADLAGAVRRAEERSPRGSRRVADYTRPDRDNVVRGIGRQRRARRSRRRPSDPTGFESSPLVC